MTKDDHKDSGKDAEYDHSRRRFVKNTGIAVGGVVGGSLLGGFLTNQFQSDKTAPQQKSVQTQDVASEARMFFTRYEDFVVLEQASERIYPEDKNGPGAIELGVPYFIDKQLASSWGTNARDYRQGPFHEQDPTADQSSLTRGEIFIVGLRKMNQTSNEQNDVPFNEANEEQQTKILQDFEAGKVDMKGIGSDSFFTLLRETVIEGVYADPLYGGNRNMAGWKMKEYPGSVPSYANIIEKKEFVEMEPVSLTDYQQKS